MVVEAGLGSVIAAVGRLDGMAVGHAVVAVVVRRADSVTGAAEADMAGDVGDDDLTRREVCGILLVGREEADDGLAEMGAGVVVGAAAGREPEEEVGVRIL